MNKLYSVLTGDLIKSSDLELVKKTQILDLLKSVFLEVEKNSKYQSQKFEIFRGDSFQGVILKPQYALHIALLILLELMKRNTQKSCRISIGLGTVNFKAATAKESDGTAFRNSGRFLDAMKNSGQFIQITSDNTRFNEEFEIHLASLNYLLEKLSEHQAEVLSLVLRGAKQIDIAKQLNISQPAVHQHIKSSGWLIIEKILNRFYSKAIKLKP